MYIYRNMLVKMLNLPGDFKLKTTKLIYGRLEERFG